MKRECEIVQDLLFSYNDRVLSKSSIELVENHLKDCKVCQDKLKEIKINKNKNKKKKKKVDYLKNVRKKLDKKTKIITISTILLVIIIILNIAVFVNYNNVASNIQIFMENDITQEELSQIEQKIIDNYKDIEITYNSSEDELNSMKEKFGDNQNLLAGYNESNNPFPASYIVKAKLKDVNNIKRDVENLDGVKKVTTYIEENPYLLFLLQIIN